MIKKQKKTFLGGFMNALNSINPSQAFDPEKEFKNIEKGKYTPLTENNLQSLNDYAIEVINKRKNATNIFKRIYYWFILPTDEQIKEVAFKAFNFKMSEVHTMMRDSKNLKDDETKLQEAQTMSENLRKVISACNNTFFKQQMEKNIRTAFEPLAQMQIDIFRRLLQRMKAPEKETDIKQLFNDLNDNIPKLELIQASVPKDSDVWEQIQTLSEEYCTNAIDLLLPDVRKCLTSIFELIGTGKSDEELKRELDKLQEAIKQLISIPISYPPIELENLISEANRLLYKDYCYKLNLLTNNLSELSQQIDDCKNEDEKTQLIEKLKTQKEDLIKINEDLIKINNESNQTFKNRIEKLLKEVSAKIEKADLERLQTSSSLLEKEIVDNETFFLTDHTNNETLKRIGESTANIKRETERIYNLLNLYKNKVDNTKIEARQCMQKSNAYLKKLDKKRNEITDQINFFLNGFNLDLMFFRDLRKIMKNSELEGAIEKLTSHLQKLHEIRDFYNLLGIEDRAIPIEKQAQEMLTMLKKQLEPTQK